MKSNFRANLVKLLTFIGGMYFVVEFLVPLESYIDNFQDVHSKISDGYVLIGTMAFAIGIINLLLVYGSKLVFKRKGWFDSLVLLFGLALMLSVSVLDWRESLHSSKNLYELNMLSNFVETIISDSKSKKKGVPEVKERVRALERAYLKNVDVYERKISLVRNVILERKEDVSKVSSSLKDYRILNDKIKNAFLVNADLPIIQELISEQRQIAQHLFNLVYETSFIKKLYRLLYDGLFVSLGAAMFSLLGIYIAIAAYRAFRIQSFEAALMLGAALLVMLGQISFGLWISEDLPAIRNWLLQNPNSSAFRAIKIGASIAGLVMAFRMWLSIESDFTSGEDF